MNLIIVGRCLVFAYLLVVLSAIFPILASEIGWQQQVLDTFVNAGSVAITGRVFIAIALIFRGNESAKLAADPYLNLFVLPDSGFFATRKISGFLRSIERAVSSVWRVIFVFGPALLFALVAVLQIRVSALSLRSLEAASLNQSLTLTQQTTQLRAALAEGVAPSILPQVINLIVPPPEQQAISELSPQMQRVELLKRLEKRDSDARMVQNRLKTQQSTALIWKSIKNVLVSLVFGYCLFWLRPFAVRNLINRSF